MDSRRFEDLVGKAIESLPEEFRDRMENVDIIIEDRPTPAQARRTRGAPREILLGLYEGVPLTERGDHYGFAMPDKITIFKRNIEAVSRDDDEVVREVRKVVIHEIGHHFGISDARLDELGWG